MENAPTTLDPEHHTTTALCGPFVAADGECVICGRLAPCAPAVESRDPWAGFEGGALG